MTMSSDNEDTLRTEDNSVLQRLRAEGAFSAFVVADWAGDSSIGRVRTQNEDRWANIGHELFMVADGMGGHLGGEIAAQALVDHIVGQGRAVVPGDVGNLVAEASSAVVAAGEQQGVSGLGSTLVLLAANGRNALIVSVGDSRVYRWRSQTLEQLTGDHTVRAELLDAGVDLEPYVERGVRLDALTSFMGQCDVDEVAFAAASFGLAVDDRFLICSDGVHGQLQEQEIAKSLELSSCADAVASLLETADAAGGRDNATAIVVEFGLGEESGGR